jgi:anti-sigma B factor antagonist
MYLETRMEQGVTVVQIGGRFDAHEVAQVAAQLETAAVSAPARVVVNLHEVTFIDSTALGRLVQGMKRCRQQAGDLRLCGLQKPVRVIFELTRLDKAFAIFASEEAALHAAW